MSEKLENLVRVRPEGNHVWYYNYVNPQKEKSDVVLLLRPYPFLCQNHAPACKYHDQKMMSPHTNVAATQNF